MKISFKIKTGIAFFTAILAVYTAGAQIPGGGWVGTAAAANANFGVSISGQPAAINANAWRGAIRTLGNGNAGAAIMWDATGIANAGVNAQNNLFIGGPSTIPIGDYWVGLQNGFGGGIVNSYVMQIHGQARANQPAMGTVHLFNNVIINAANPACSLSIGTLIPGAQLHTTGSVRFAGLANGVINSLVGIDAAGNLFRTAPSFSLGCTQAGKIPRIRFTNGNTECSQLVDNGASVGVGNIFTITSNFGYTFPGGQWLQGAPGGTVVPPAGNFRLSVDGVTRSLAYFAFSDKRLKKNIRPITNSISLIKQINGVTYEWDKSLEKAKSFCDMPQVGFIAQEIAKIIPEAVVQDAEGYYSMNYSALLPVLTEGIKEQQLKIKNLRLQITELRNKLNQLTPGDIKIKVNSIEVIPNPITGISVVSYKLDNANAASFLIISDLQGKLLKQISLAKNQQQCQVQVSKKDLPNGMYVFAIVSGNAEVQSKKVLVSE